MELKHLSVNEGQASFLEASGANLLLSASAGSGKTYTMIKKLVNLILIQKVDVKNLLVVTFTKASAAEMKQKLLTELQLLANFFLAVSKGKADSIKDYDIVVEKDEALNLYEHLVQNIENINYSDIGDFHAIFKKVITKYFYELNIDPAFSILSEQEQEIIFQKAMKNVFNNYINDADQDFFMLQETFNKKRKDTNLKDVIKTLHKTSKEKVNYNEWFENVLNTNFNTDVNSNASAIFLFEFYKNAYKSQTNRVAKLLLEAQMLQADQKVQDYILSYKNMIDSVESFENFSQFATFVFAFEGFATTPLKGDKYNVELLELKEKLSNLQEYFKKQLIDKAKKDLVSHDASFFVKATKHTKNVLQKLNQVLLKVDLEFTKLKRQKSSLDFNDLQTLMLELTDNQKVLNELKSTYKYIFIDEFQDVNEVQYSIVSKITSNNNLHMIGDVKQSIYEFRLASPKIFVDIYNEYKQNGKTSKAIDLNANFRSSDFILQFVNFLFQKLITKQTIGIDYKDSALVCGNAGLSEYDKKVKMPTVELSIIDSEKQSKQDEDKQEDNDDEDIQDMEIEALQVVKTIVDLKGKPYYNTETKSVQLLDYKDIAVLTRDGGTFTQVLYKTLNDYKIPSSITSKGSLFKTGEVLMLFGLIKVINNQVDDYSLVSTLVSPIFDFSYNDLSKIRLVTNDKNVSYYNAIKNYLSLKDGVDKSIVKKLTHFFDTLNEYRFDLTHTTIYEFLYSILAKYDLFNYYKSRPNGTTAVNNITEFLRLVNSPSFEYDLSFCIEYLTILSENENFKLNYSSGNNAVTVMTMHKSKGLEFPAVILAQLGKSFSKNKGEELVLSNELGFGIKLKDIENKVQQNTLQYNAAKVQKSSSELKEQIRLFYVATTRAKNYLHLIGTYSTKDCEKVLYKPVLKLGSFMELVLYNFGQDSITKLQNNTSSFIINEHQKNQLQVNHVDKNSFATSSAPEFKLDLNNTITKDVIEIIKSNINYKPKPKTNVAIKNTVTSLLKEEDYVLHNPTPKTLTNKDYDSSKNNLSIDIGLAYHTIMQSIDYKDDLDIIKQKVAASLQTIEKHILPYVSVDKIMHAVNSVKELITNTSVVLKEKQFIMQSDYNKIVTSSAVDEKVLVQGVVDLIIIDNNTAIIIDFKTNRNTNKQVLIDTYSLQLQLYAQAVQIGYKVPVIDKYLYSFDLNTLIRV